jgi:hypothetical protein
MMCVIRHRRLKQGRWKEFRAAWEPASDAWAPQLERVYHLRSVDDENEVISLGFFSGSVEDVEASRDHIEVLQAEDERLGRIAPFEEETRFGGLFEVIEEIVRPGPAG